MVGKRFKIIFEHHLAIIIETLCQSQFTPISSSTRRLN